MKLLPDIFKSTALADVFASPVPYQIANPSRKMRDYQLRASDKLTNGTPIRDPFTGQYRYDLPQRSGTAVHIDMGLGKTVIGLTAIVNWFANRTIDKPVLVIAPIKVCETVWRQEAKLWSHTQHLTFSLLRGSPREREFMLRKPSHVYLINPEGLDWLAKYLRHDWSAFDALLLDESSMFKDPGSKRFKALSNYGSLLKVKGEDGKALRDANGKMIRLPPHRFKRIGVLTGTPAPSSYLNLWAPLYLCDHGERLHTDFETYKGRFFHQGMQVAEHVFKYDLNAEEAEKRPAYIAKDQAPERIHELIADITVELNAEDYGVLPKTIGDASKGEPPPTHLHRVELPPALREKYDVLEKDALIELEKDVIMAQNGGAKSMMCWQIANGALYVTDSFGRKTTEALHDEKLRKMVEVLDELQANTIIPYYFKSDFARITQTLDKAGMSYLSFSSRNAEKVVDRWNGKYVPILLLHPQSAGHGLNLQFGGHHLLWFTMVWSLERYLQTNARIARSGQDNIVGIHHIVTSRTTDELMLRNLREHGGDQERFRAALRWYQNLRGMGINSNPLEGLGI